MFEKQKGAAYGEYINNKKKGMKIFMDYEKCVCPVMNVDGVLATYFNTKPK